MEPKVVIYPINDVPKELIGQLRAQFNSLIELVQTTDDLTQMVKLESLLQVLDEQLEYLDTTYEEDVNVFFCVAYIENIAVGGVFLFQKGEIMMMQGIAKFYSDYKLNNILIPEIEVFGIIRGVKEIIVTPP